MNNQIPLTIFIHGTYPQELIPLIGKKLNQGPMQRFFYCPPGLTRLTNLDRTLHHTELVWMLSNKSPKEFPPEHTYIFGWSGKLDPQERLAAARDFYKQIRELVADYGLRYNDPLFMKLITFSHGGNVALNLVHVVSSYHPITINELILLACPVQRITASAIGNPMFEKVYSLHSHFDLLQILDPQGLPELAEMLQELFATSPEEFLEGVVPFVNTALKSFERDLFFSRRHFHPHKNLIQVRITNGLRSPIHLEFILPTFIEALPNLLAQIRSWHKEHPIQRYMTDDITIDISK